MPNLSHLSPMRGIKRILGLRSLFEVAKSVVKLTAVGVACFLVVAPLYENSVGLVSTDIASMPGMMQQSLLAVLLATTLVAVAIAGIDVPYQHWSYHRRMRMSFEEMRKELRESEGDPHVKARQRKLRQRRAQRRMMHEVPKATVVITNPTHVAVALRYQRGKDPAPVVVAKSAELVAADPPYRPPARRGDRGEPAARPGTACDGGNRRDHPAGTFRGGGQDHRPDLGAARPAPGPAGRLSRRIAAKSQATRRRATSRPPPGAQRHARDASAGPVLPQPGWRRCAAAPGRSPQCAREGAG